MSIKKQSLVLLIGLLSSISIFSQSPKAGIYYRTAQSKQDKTVEIKDIIESQSFTVIWKGDGKDGKDLIRTLRAIPNTKGLYAYYGAGFFYYMTVEEGYLEKYNFSSSNVAGGYEIIALDKSVAQSKINDVKYESQMLLSKQKSLCIYDFHNAYYKFDEDHPAAIKNSEGYNYIAVNQFDGKSAGSQKLKIFFKDNSNNSFRGAKGTMKMALTASPERYTFVRDFLNPNRYLGLQNIQHAAYPEVIVQFNENGIHYWKSAGNRGSGVFGDNIKLLNEEQKRKYDFMMNEIFENYVSEYKSYIDAINDNFTLPEPGMVDQSIEKEALVAMQNFAKRKGWKETFYKIIITSDTWSRIVRHDYSGRIIEVAAVATWPNGKCTFQKFELIAYTNGNGYNKQLDFFKLVSDSQREIDCQK